jgi:ubiquinone/menaquinone biosynthesis C-methylase UbiE
MGLTRMPGLLNPIVETYSQLAEKYDEDANLESCWGRVAEEALASLCLKDGYRIILDVGCGTGRALLRLASTSKAGVQFIGVDPAANMRKRAIQRTKDHANVRILDGRFEEIPLPSASVDYLYSIFAFHWTTDLSASVKEMARVLKPNGEMDLFFIGRNNGREFIRRTTPIFLKYMGPARLLDSARLRRQLTRDAAFELFANCFNHDRLSVEESYQTYYDTLEGHWSWWLRIEGHFLTIPLDKKEECNSEVRRALLSLVEEKGIPYTLHQLRLRLQTTDQSGEEQG